MRVETLIRLTPTAAMSRRDGRFRVDRTGFAPLVIEEPVADEEAIIEMLRTEWLTRDELLESLEISGNAAKLAHVYYLLEILDRIGILETAVAFDEVPVAKLGFVRPPPGVPAGASSGPGKLSPFVLLKPSRSGLVLTVADAPSTVEILDARVAEYIYLLASGASPPGRSSLPDTATRALVELLRRAGALTFGVDENRIFMWDVHDLTFHFRTRHGNVTEPYGACFPFAGQADPPPAVRPARTQPPIFLPAPDMSAVERADPPFSTVLEGRRSTREHASRSLELAHLGEFLYRAARVRSITAGSLMETSSRPYPSGGACHELELYLFATACEGVPRIPCRYDPKFHGLYPQAPCSETATERLIQQARAACQMQHDPQVLIIIAARFGRVQWKYCGMPYALTLKHVGVLIQTMYLVAQAMGLAACAIGGGSAIDFAEATGLDPLIEGSVGEFIIGTMPVLADAAAR